MVLLSFDIEEFDMPLEYGGVISFADQIRVSQQGTLKILRILDEFNLPATFFSTVVFAENSQEIIKQLLKSGHELASHTWYHSQFSLEDLKNSRERLATLFQTEVTGLRMPRMSEVPAADVTAAGYRYNSSLNPTFLPGRYNNASAPKTAFREGSLWQLPATVSPVLRLPLFWLSLHNFPLEFYLWLCRRAYRKYGYLNLYFHPWEFEDTRNPEWKMPGIALRNSGLAMEKRFVQMIKFFRSHNMPFSTISNFLDQK